MFGKCFENATKAYNDSFLSKIQAYHQHKAYKEGREVVDDFPRSERSSTFATDKDIEEVIKIAFENQDSSLREI